MKQRIPSPVIYLISALALVFYFDALYGGPVTHRLGTIHAGIAGATLFVVACVLSLFSLRVGLVCGLAASILSWPYFGVLLFVFPWRGVPEILHYAMWGDTLSALLILIIASIYSLSKIGLSLRERASI
jgi:hypothetical protein